MIVRVVTPTPTEVFTLDEAKDFLRVDGTDEDTYITSLIQSAREAFEAFASRYVLPTVVDEFLVGGFPVAKPYWPSDGLIYLSKPNVTAVASVKYHNTSGAETTYSTDDYREFNVDSDFTGLESVDGWPSDCDTDRANAVTIRYTAGWADASSVPGPVKDGMNLYMAQAYDNRMNNIKQLPTRVEFLWDKYRLRRF